MLNGYPRPQLERKEWLNLNGEWQFFFDDEKSGGQRMTVKMMMKKGERKKNGTSISQRKQAGFRCRTLMKQNTVESVRKNFIRLSGITGR